MSLRLNTSSPSSSSTGSPGSSTKSRILDRIRTLTTATGCFNRPTLDQYRSNDRADLRALVFHDETQENYSRQSGQQGHEDGHSSHGPGSDGCQEVDPVSLLFPESETPRKKNLSPGRRFLSRTLKLTLCAIVLLTVLPSGQGAPVVEPDSLVYQENFARSKRFIVPLLIGAIWGWLTGPTIVPSPLANLALQQYNRTTGHLRSPESNRTKRAVNEPFFQPGLSFFNIFGFPFRVLSYLAAKTVSGDFKLEALPRPVKAEAPHREKRSLAIFDLVTGALTHWILPENLIQNTEELANKTTPTFAPLSIQLLQASRNVVSTKDAIRHTRHAETPLLRKSIEDLHDIIAHRINEFTPSETTWHPADIWLLTFTILNVFIGLLGVAYQHQTIIAILSKKPLTEGRDMKQDFSRVIHI